MTAPSRPTILIVDDDRSTREGLERALRSKYEVRTAETAERALELLAETDVDVLLSDVRMPGMDGLTLMQRAMARQPGLICILLTAYGSVDLAEEAVAKGAHEFLLKPVNLDHLEVVIQRALRHRQIESENLRLRKELNEQYGLENIVGRSEPMQRVFETIVQAAPTEATVLIQGESGTGKELVAHAIHRLSPRAQGPFVVVHCAALSSNLLESELFGHEKGAFTGAIARRRGRFEMADGGTLFLDEVSEIDPAIQVKLLRVLEQRTFERVGGSETLHVDLRLVAATNQDLRARVAEGRFREDLFFRLDVVNITLPPLRERREDIPLLCDHFIRELAARNHKPLEGITPEAVAILSAYSWPGNVRELRNTIEKMVVLSRSRRLTARDIPAYIREAVRAAAGAERSGAPLSAWAPGERPSGQGSELLIPGPMTLAEAEKRLILAALARHGNSRTRAARELGISRRTLHRKLREWKIVAPEKPETENNPSKDQPAG